MTMVRVLITTAGGLPCGHETFQEGATVELEESLAINWQKFGRVKILDEKIEFPEKDEASMAKQHALTEKKVAGPEKTKKRKLLK